MRTSKSSDNLIRYTLLCFWLAFWSCSAPNEVVSAPGREYSKSEMSQGMFKSIWNNPEVFPLLDSYSYGDVLGHLSQIESKVVGPRQTPYQQTTWLVDSKDQNAWMLPDGRTFYTTGMLKALQSDNEFASIVALLESDRRRDLTWNQFLDKNTESDLVDCESRYKACELEVLYSYTYSHLSQEDLKAMDTLMMSILCPSGFTYSMSAVNSRLSPMGDWMQRFPSTEATAKIKSNCKPHGRADRYPYMLSALNSKKIKYASQSKNSIRATMPGAKLPPKRTKLHDQ